MTESFYDLENDEFGPCLVKLQDGDDRHQGESFAFPAGDRTQLDADHTAWLGINAQVNGLQGDKLEFGQTRDEKLKAFRGAVRPARDWVLGQFKHGDERPERYGLGKMPPRSISGCLDYAQTLFWSNQPERNLDPALPEWLLTSIQEAHQQFVDAIAAYDQVVQEHKDALAERRALREAINQRVRSWRQYLYVHLGRDSHLLADYGF